jgi:hypothetical protein
LPIYKQALRTGTEDLISAINLLNIMVFANDILWTCCPKTEQPNPLAQEFYRLWEKCHNLDGYRHRACGESGSETGSTGFGDACLQLREPLNKGDK